FDLTGATPDACSVVITEPDGSTLTVPTPFIIEQGGAPNVWVDIIGRNQMRIGREQTYYVVYGNSGNVDSDDPFTLFVSFPNFFSWNLDSSQPLVTSFQTEVTTVLALPASFVPPGSTLVIPIQLTVPGDPQYASKQFQITLWTNSP